MEKQCKNILLVEDDEVNRKLVRVVLGNPPGPRPA